MTLYTVVNSYQGAFGPPTKGHYEAMLYATRKTLEEYPDKSILMLFMPTKKSGSKPHLELTQDERIQALQEFCIMLREEIKDPRVTFEASKLEYEIFEKYNSSATIYTLQKLKETYPGSTIILTMGLDNLFDLPYWQEIENYAFFTKKIYVPLRNIEQEELSKLISIDLNGTQINFNKFASWSKISKNISSIKYDDSDLKLKLEKNWTKPQTNPEKMMEIKTLKQLLESIKFVMLEKPSPTSSSLLRAALKKYYTELNTSTDYLAILNSLMARPPVPKDSDKINIDPYFIMNTKTQHLEKNTSKFMNKYRKAFSAGRKTRRSKTRRTN